MGSREPKKTTAGDLIIQLLKLPTSVEVGMFPQAGGVVELRTIDKEGNSGELIWTDPDFEYDDPYEAVS